MCSCVAKVTAPPPPTDTHTHRRAHMHTNTHTVSWLTLTLPNVSSEKFGYRSSGWLRDTDSKRDKQLLHCDKLVIGKRYTVTHTPTHIHIHTPTPVALSCCIHLLQKIYSSCQWQFNCHAAQVPERCQSPAATHRSGDQSFRGATSIHSPFSFNSDSIKQCKQVIKLPWACLLLMH